MTLTICVIKILMITYMYLFVVGTGLEPVKFSHDLRLDTNFALFKRHIPPPDQLKNSLKSSAVCLRNTCLKLNQPHYLELTISIIQTNNDFYMVF